MPDEPFLAALTSDGPDAVLVVHGPVDVAGAVELRDQLRSITSNGTVSRSVDLSRVTLLASAGVHVLYEARDRSTAHHERLHLLAPRGSTAHHVLELVGLHPLEQI
jgi:anti-anti-sigma factor